MRLRKVKKLAKGNNREDKSHFSIGSWVEIVGGMWADSLYITASDSKRKDNVTFIQYAEILTVLLTFYYLSLLNIKNWVVYISWGFKKNPLIP